MLMDKPDNLDIAILDGKFSGSILAYLTGFGDGFGMAGLYRRSDHGPDGSLEDIAYDRGWGDGEAAAANKKTKPAMAVLNPNRPRCQLAS